MGTVKRQEWIWVISISTVIVAAAALPYLTGYLAQTPAWRFSGSVMDQVDYHSHLILVGAPSLLTRHSVSSMVPHLAAASRSGTTGKQG
jgi:hypothetical protein